jgi:hypothetical protein
MPRLRRWMQFSMRCRNAEGNRLNRHELETKTSLAKVKNGIKVAV